MTDIADPTQEPEIAEANPSETVPPEAENSPAPAFDEQCENLHELTDESAQDLTNDTGEADTTQPDDPEGNANSEELPIERSETEESSVLPVTPVNSALNDEIVGLLKQLAKDFEIKLKYDASKQHLIDKLYAENQQFKEGIVKKFRHMMILAVIEQIDDATKQTAFFANAEFTEDNYRKLLDNYCDVAEGFQNMLLEKFDVSVYRCEAGAQFDPKRQRSLKPIPTDEQAKHKLVKSSLRPGYETDDGFVLRPELVEVYVFSNNTAPSVEVAAE